MTFHPVYNTTSATSGAWTASSSGAPACTSGFWWVRLAWPLVFCVVFCRSLFVCFYFWQLCCLSFYSSRLPMWYLFSQYCKYIYYIVIYIFLLNSMENNHAIYPCISTLIKKNTDKMYIALVQIWIFEVVQYFT